MILLTTKNKISEMKKNERKALNVRELVNRYQTNTDRISEIAELCEREKRVRTEEEDREFEVLVRENQLLQMKMQVATAEHLRENPNAAEDASRIIRENMSAGRQTQILLVRDLMMVADTAGSAVVPLKIQDIVEPLTEGLILDKLGLPFPTGLAGDYVWPTYEAVEATIAGEGVVLTDTKIPLGKLTAAPQRIGLAIPITRQTIMQTDGLIETIAKKLMPLAVSKLINKILLSPTKLPGATSLVGPFAGIAAKDVFQFSAEPTYKEFVTMKAAVLATGIDGDNLCWTMTKAQKAIAEATPKDKGSGIMVCENDHIAGLPVFTSNYAGEGNIGLGDWRYQPMGLFGAISFVIDPYSQARKDAVDFVLNANYATTTLYKEAFKLGKVAAAAGA